MVEKSFFRPSHGAFPSRFDQSLRGGGGRNPLPLLPLFFFQGMCHTQIALSLRIKVKVLHFVMELVRISVIATGFFPDGSLQCLRVPNNTEFKGS